MIYHIFVLFYNFTESSSPKKCNGINKSDDDDVPLFKKTFELPKHISSNFENSKRPRVCFI